jgi:hypothetical protein
MDPFSLEELTKLMNSHGEPCVSIYMPAHRIPDEARQDPIRFKNLLKEAEERLIRTGLREAEGRKFLEPLRKLQEDSAFWQSQADGLAIFLSPDLFHHLRLPARFDELVVVADRFHVKPLIPLFAQDRSFWILALSQNEIRLFEADRFHAWETELETVPGSLGEALKYDQPESQLQFHTKTPGGGALGKRPAIFHGHGVGIDESKDNLRRYFLQIERGLQEVLRVERAPLVLAGVEYLLAIYREVNTYQHLLPEGVTGNPEGLGPEELHARAWEIVEPRFLKEREEVISQYRQLAGTGRTSGEIREILPAAFQGRVDKLLVAVGIQVWGNFDSHSKEVRLSGEPGAGSQDLLDLAAVQTLLKGGKVFVVEPGEVPGESPIVALYRY